MIKPKPINSQIQVHMPASLGKFVAIGAGASNKNAQMALVSLYGIHRMAGIAVTHLITDPQDLYWDNDVVTMWWYENHPNQPLDVSNNEIQPVAAVEVMTHKAFESMLQVGGFVNHLQLLPKGEAIGSRGDLPGWRYGILKAQDKPDTYIQVAPEGMTLCEAAVEAFVEITFI